MTTSTIDYANNSMYFFFLKHFFTDDSNRVNPCYDFTKNIVTGSDLDSQIAISKGKVDANKYELLRLFNQQFVKYAHHITYKDAISKTNNVIGLISTLNYAKCAIEITPDNSLFFNLKFNNDIDVHIGFYYDPFGGNEKESFFTIYEGDNIILENFGEIKNVILSIESCLEERVVLM